MRGTCDNQTMRLRYDVLLGLGVGSVSLILGWWVLGVSLADVGKPWANGDGLGIYAMAKAIADAGWHQGNPRLGFPNVQDYYLLPNGDLRFLLEMKVVALFSKNPFTVANVMNLAAFFLVGSFAFWLMRIVRVSAWIAAPLAVSIALLPWHFTRLAGHFFLADYSSVVLGLIAIMLLRRWLAESTTALDRQLLLRCLAMLGISVYVGLSGFYYAVILLVLAVAILVRPAAARFSVEALLPSLTFIIAVPGALLSWLTYQKLFAITVGNPAIYTRQYRDSEVYGGSITSLFLPGSRSGIRRLAAWREEYDVVTLFHTESKADNALIGIVAVVVAFALLWAVLAPVGVRSRGNGTCQWVSGRLAGVRTRLVEMATEIRDTGLALGFLIAVFFFASGGFGAFFAFLVTNQIRAWGRFSIVVIIIAVCIFGIVLTRLALARAPRVSLVVVCIALFVMLGADQVRSRYAMPVAEISATQQDAQALVQEIEAQSKPGCPVLSLPIIEFPESGPVNGMFDYDEFWPYVSSSNLRFSYGVLKQSEWSGFQAQFVGEVSPASIGLLRDAGVCGILVDTFGYPDQAAGLVVQLQELTGGIPVVSPAGRWVYVPVGTL
jgi:hypothetical protein